MVFTSPAIFKSFFIFKGKLPKILPSGLVTSISEVAAMLRFMVRPNVILKSEFANM